MVLPEFRARLSEDRLVALGLAKGWLICGGPKISRHEIAQINKRSPAIARGIFTPSGDRQIAPATVAAAGAADDDMIAAVGQEMNLRYRWRGIREYAHHSFRFAIKRPRRLQDQVLCEHADSCPGHALLQKQIRSLEQRTGHEAPLHGGSGQLVDQSQQDHPLIVHHEGSDGGASFVRWEARWGAIHSFIEG